MNTPEQKKQFVELLFSEMEETYVKLYAARHERYKADVECMNLQDEIRFLQQKLAYYEAQEKALAFGEEK